ncbi:MAG: M16 family metallopeptidase [Candidatus Sumerlaeaceae bacterium]|jgi:predicted Zn-dependent peptidase
MMISTGQGWIVEKASTGLTIAARHMPNQVVTIDTWIATGSAREDDSTNGISHFLEHMLFKGTPRFGVGELDRHIMELGGVWNAGTSMDFTHYYVTVAAPYFHDALDAIADMIQHASIDPGEFEKERQVILEEYRRKQDDPWGWLFDELYRLTYEKGPYRRPVIGTFETISGLTREQMVDYYRRTYTADATTILVVGDVDPENAVAEVMRFFSDMAPTNNPWPVAQSEVAFNRGTRLVVPRDVHETYLALSFPGPGIEAEREIVALDLLTTILGSGRSCRLMQRLREDLGLVEDVGMTFSTHKAPGMTYGYAVLDAKVLDAALEEFVLIVQSLPQMTPSEAELAKAKRILRNDFYYATETTSGQSGVMGYYMTLTGSDQLYHRYLGLVESTNIQDLLCVAEKYLQEHDPVVLAAVPKSIDSRREEGQG